MPDGVYMPVVKLLRSHRTIVLPSEIRLDTKPPVITVKHPQYPIISPDGDGHHDVVHVPYRDQQAGARDPAVRGTQVASHEEPASRRRAALERASSERPRSAARPAGTSSTSRPRTRRATREAVPVRDRAGALRRARARPRRRAAGREVRAARLDRRADRALAAARPLRVAAHGNAALPRAEVRRRLPPLRLARATHAAQCTRGGRDERAAPHRPPARSARSG